jgi:hypothetical protein
MFIKYKNTWDVIEISPANGIDVEKTVRNILLKMVLVYFHVDKMD